MSDITIRNGTGNGNMAEVDNHGRLAVRANHVSHQAHHSTFHKNYYFNYANTVLNGTSEKACFLFYNGGTGDAEVYELFINCNGAYTATINIDGTYTSGGTVITPVNSNLGSGKDSTATVYEGGVAASLVVDTLKLKTIMKKSLNANQSWDSDFQGALVIPPKHSLSINITGANTNLVEITVGNSFHDLDTKL